MICAWIGAASSVHSGHRHRVQVRVDRHRGNRRRAVLALESAARSVRRQAAQSRRERLRAHRIHLRNPDERLADGHHQEQRLGSARRTELRDLSRRRVSRGAGRRAEDRAGDAGAPDGSPGLCAVPVGLCQRSQVQRRYARRGHEEASGVRILRRPDLPVVRDQTPRRKGILERDPRIAWFDKRPPQGPGRVDTFNPYKAMFAAETNFDSDTTVGTADLPSLWNQRIRQGLWLHWDGNNDSVDERNKSAAIGAGATPDSIDLAALDRIANWILDLKPPSFPADRINAAAGEHGPAALSAALRKLSRRRPAERGPDDRHRRDRHRPRAAQFLYAGTGEDDEHHRHGQALEVLALPQDERLRRHAARRHLAAGARTCTTDRCPRFARCCSSTSARRVSIAPTTSTTFRAWVSSQRPRGREARRPLRHVRARQWQRRPHLRPRAFRSRIARRCSSTSRRCDAAVSFAWSSPWCAWRSWRCLPWSPAPSAGGPRSKSSSSTDRSARRIRRAFRTGSGRCCRGCSRTSCPPGGYGALGMIWEPGHDTADRLLEEDDLGRLARRHQLRVLPHRSRAHEPRRGADDRARRTLASVRSAGVLAISRRDGQRSAVQCQRHDGRDREDDDAVVVRLGDVPASS